MGLRCWRVDLVLHSLPGLGARRYWPSVRCARMDAAPRPTLSPLALEALRLIGPRGMSELEAARALNYGRTYMRQVLSEAYRQLGAGNARQAIYLATRLGLL